MSFFVIALTTHEAGLVLARQL